MHLAEHHILLLTVHSAPGADAALQSSANARREIRVAPSKFIEYRYRPQAGCCLEQWDNLGLEDVSQRVGPATVARHLLV
jgi:hypothetical protein